VDTARCTAALLALVEEDRARRCAQVRDEAERQAALLLQEARAAATSRVREALGREKRRLRDRLAACEAALATERRLHDQRRFRRLLDETWRRLPAALAERWSGAATRAEWVTHVVASARAALPPGGQWTIVHGPGWPAAEREELAAGLREHGVAVAFREDATAGPGLEIRSDGNRVDGTVTGLTADAGEVGARLLESLAAGDAEGSP